MKDKLRVLLLDLDQTGQDLLPSRTAEEVVVDQKKRIDAVIADRVAHPLHHRLGLARTHRAAHHVLDAAIGAGEGTSARRVDRGHGRIEEAR